MKRNVSILILLIISTLLSSIQASADTCKDIYDIYDIGTDTKLSVAETELRQIQSDYNKLVKEYAFTEFYNTAASLTSSDSVREELNMAQPKLQEIETAMSESIDSSIEEIMSLDNEYVATMEYVNFLLKALDSYNNITYHNVPKEDITEVETKLNTAKQEYIDVEDESNIGDVKNLIHPVQAILEVSSEYGTRVKLSDNSKTEFHDGIDIKAAIGTGVLALFKGKVIYAGYDQEKGETVKINHGDGIITEYRHLQERYVKEGDIVKQYQKIGTICSSEGEPHLHLSLYIKNKSYDPMKLLSKEVAE